MKSATEFGARAESYSRTRRGPNSNNVFLALLVPCARSPPFFSRAVSTMERGGARERAAGGGGAEGKRVATYPPFTAASNISLRLDSSARIEVARNAALNSD